MDIIAQASAVGCVVVVPKNLEFFAGADGHLRNKRHQIVWYAVRVFPDPG